MKHADDNEHVQAESSASKGLLNNDDDDEHIQAFISRKRPHKIG